MANKVTFAKDPNLVNTNPNIVNGIPQYQDMYIYANLTAQQRGRTVLISSGKGVSQSKDYSQNEIQINFLGVNQNKNPQNPNYMNFTTNWYDGSSPDGQQYEGFGISNIKVIINSSFVPQINIQFIDIRGLAFFNQTNSPYRILFDFPPPIFTLTIKGYYGKAIQYQIHLVKYTTEFKAENGNFIIDAQFIAMTYAPLTDILFKYIINTPLIGGGTFNPSTTNPPSNTFELILKLKQLYSTGLETINNSSDKKTYEDAVNRVSITGGVLEFLQTFPEDVDLVREGHPLLETQNNSSQMLYLEDNFKDLMNLDSFGKYNQMVEGMSTSYVPTSTSQRLYISYEAGDETAKQYFLFDTNPNSKKIDALNAYRKKLLDKVSENRIGVTFSESDISTAKWVKVDDNNNRVYIDITSYYLKLYKRYIALEEERTQIMEKLQETVNNLVNKKLGMLPTIYNIFKLILNDVDKFFNTLRRTVDSATDHHERFKSLILNHPTYRDYRLNETIYPFPLVIKQTPVCGNNGNAINKEERVAPIDLSAEITEAFPEINLVNDFINTFFLQNEIAEQLNMKDSLDGGDSSRWLPFSPIDSRIGTTDLSSPYFGIDRRGNEPIYALQNPSKNSKATNFFEIILKRFYVLSQNSFPDKFYGSNTSSNSAKAIRELFANYEAANVAISIYNTDLAKNMMTIADTYANRVDSGEFYNFLANELSVENYGFTGTKENFNLSSDPNVAGATYTNKANPNFNGLRILDSGIQITEQDSSTKDALQNFHSTVTKTRKDRIQNPEAIFSFTNENLFYIKDRTEKTSNIAASLDSRFISPNAENITIGAGYEYNTSNPPIYMDSITFDGTLNRIYTNNAGNTVFPVKSIRKSNSVFENMIEKWADILTDNDTALYNELFNTTGNDKLAAIIILSNFGYSLSPFNQSYKLNSMLFSVPAVVEAPNFVPYYVGALIGIERNDAMYNQLYNFCKTGAGRWLNNSCTNVFADIVDVNNQLSTNDKMEFQTAFNTFFNNGKFTQIRDFIKLLINENEVKNAESIRKKRNAYKDLLTNKYINSIVNPLMERLHILNYSELTFQRNVSSQSGYKSLATLNTESSAKKTIHNEYFKTFLQTLSQQIKNRETTIIEKTKANKAVLDDRDIVTQTYYSFKNINDKWLSGNNQNANFGYPFNDPKSPQLINLFAFVDRAMNPIGNTIINPEVLINLFDDPTVSVFSVISQLLSLNGFEFFPLQNFIDYSDGQTWENSFKIDTTGLVDTKSYFVCMYIGGASSYPTGIGQFGEFEDDGIVDLNAQLPDFSLGDCDPVPEEDNQKNTNKDFPWGQVQAMRVKFGEQNQSMFTGIKIDSKEYPETNESINILSRLAGDNKQNAPVPKGQNLYNLYENRSYKATIAGLGNVMIQPTQYFQIENVPLYNGAYIILSVEHDIEPNKMTTSFSGTKILKYPIPRVLQPASILGFDGGSTVNTNRKLSSSGDITTGGVEAISADEMVRHNSMYSERIQ